MVASFSRRIFSGAGEKRKKICLGLTPGVLIFDWPIKLQWEEARTSAQPTLLGVFGVPLTAPDTRRQPSSDHHKALVLGVAVANSPDLFSLLTPSVGAHW